MADERTLITQELASAKYLTDSSESAEPEDAPPPRRVRPQRSGLEQAMGWLSPIVLILVLGAGVGLYLKKENSIRSGMGRFRERTSSPIDFMLWMAGSDKTFKEGVTDAINEASRKTAADLQEMQARQPKFELGNVDFESTWFPKGKK